MIVLKEIRSCSWPPPLPTPIQVCCEEAQIHGESREKHWICMDSNPCPALSVAPVPPCSSPATVYCVPVSDCTRTMSRAHSEFLTYYHEKKKKDCCCLKQLHFGVIYHAAIDNWSRIWCDMECWHDKNLMWTESFRKRLLSEILKHLGRMLLKTGRNSRRVLAEA